MKKFFTFLAAALLSAGLFAESTVTINKSADVQLSFAQDSVSLSFDNGLITTFAEEKKILVTAVDNNTHKYSVALGIQTENIIGEFTEANLIAESSVIMKENAELVHFRTAQIKIVAGNGDGDYRVDAELLGDDGVAYKVVINVPFVQATVTKSFNNGLITTSAEDKAILVSAVDTDNHKYSVALGIQSKEIVGEFTEKDLIYASSVIMKENGELVHILGAHITIVAGNGNGDYQVEAELLGYDFVLYDLSIYVKAVQQIVTKSFDNGLITTSAEDEAILVTAVDTDNHKYSVALGINSKEIVGEFTEKDLIYASSVIMKENGELVHILGAHITIVAGNGNGDYQVEAELLGYDFVLYDLSIYVKAVQQIVTKSFDNGLITTSAEDEAILVSAVDTDNHKYSVALGINSKEIVGEFTEKDLIYASSVIMKENGELVHILGAHITIVAGNGNGDYQVEAELLGYDFVLYDLSIYVKAVQQIVTKSFDNGLITTSAEDEAILVTAVDTDNHKYSVALGIQSENIVGEFTEKDLIYASSVIMKENGELVHILGAHITIVAGNGNGDYQVEAELLGYDFVLYDLSIYVKAVQQIVTKSFDNGSITTSAEDQVFVSAIDSVNHKLSIVLGINSKDIVGEFTEKDLIAEASVIMKENAEFVHILGAHITIVAGNGDGDYKVEAELLGYDFVLYDLSIYVKAVQQIVTKSFDNGSITTSAEDQVFVSAIDSVNHKLSIVLGINSKDIVGEFTEKDLIAEASVIMKENAEFVHILGAHITIVAGNGDGDYKVEAELLGYDFVFYDLSIYVPAQSEGVENVQGNKVQSTKVIRDGQLLIEKNGVLYNAQGAVIK